MKKQIITCDFKNKQHTDAIVKLINEYILDEMGGGNPLQGKDAERLVDGLAEHPSVKVLFALYDEEIAGLTVCFVNFGTFLAKKFISIHDVVVKKEFRGKGIGRALMEGIVELSEELDCSKITLEVREDNIRAQKLYRSLGFKDGNPPMYFWTKYI
jgi:ribosomal protein S18 acetylase RimI-like enzyme